MLDAVFHLDFNAVIILDSGDNIYMIAAQRFSQLTRERVGLDREEPVWSQEANTKTGQRRQQQEKRCGIEYRWLFRIEACLR
jgi:hypothetical protein